MKSKEQLICDIKKIFRSCIGNRIPTDIAADACAEIPIFEEPVIGFSSAEDTLYAQYKQPDVIGDTFMMPAEWLSGAKTIISFFLPFSEEVRRSNRNDPQNISSEWLRARFEGQVFLNSFTEKIKTLFDEMGVRSCVPATDPRFKVIEKPLEEGNPEGKHMESAWSERHAAYASGLGTFCLSRGLISSKGVAGRYGSIIISEHVEPDVRPYTGIYDYCTKCGACISHCPVNAISKEHGKNQLLCSNWLDATKERYSPRYGCGKCQVGVPCECSIPK